MDTEYARIEAGPSSRSGDRIPDAKVIKTHYARDNNSKILSFSLQEEPNLCLDFSSIQIGCRVKIPKSHLPENGLSAKLFKSLNIELNSQLITATKATNELPLIDYLQMTGNFAPDYLSSANYGMGYFDQWNVSTSEISGSNSGVLSNIENLRKSFANTSDGNWQIFDLLFRPPVGILNSTKPLLPKTDMVLSFDRAVSDLAMISKVPDTANPLENEVIPLENVFLRATYYSSPYLRNYFQTIEEKEISYKFDETQVLIKNIPKGLKNIRFSNLIGGNTPSHLFAGVIPSSALMGNNELSSTAFKQHNVLEFDLTIDGQSMQGFPIKTENTIPMLAYDSYLKATNRNFNNLVNQTIPIRDYANFHFVYGHKFSGEVSDSGWIGINLKLSEEYNENFSLGKI